MLQMCRSVQETVFSICIVIDLYKIYPTYFQNQFVEASSMLSMKRTTIKLSFILSTPQIDLVYNIILLCDFGMGL